MKEDVTLGISRSKPPVAREASEKWDLIITSKSRLLDLNLGEVYRYRDLMFLFVRRDFVAQYKQTILGPLWHFIQPILTTLMFLLIFGKIARIPTDGVHPILFYMSGITLWNYFSVCLTSTSNTFTINANIFGKVYFPRLVSPLSVIISNLIKFAIQFLLLSIAIVWYHVHGYPFVFDWHIILIPVILVIMAGIALGSGILISSITTKYKDFSVLLSFVVQLGMYATPVVYPMSFLKGKSYAWVLELNPLSPLVEAFRFSLFGKGTFDMFDLLYSIGWMFFVLFLGLICFNRVEKSFMDTV